MKIPILKFNTYATFLRGALRFSQRNANFKNELFVFLQFLTGAELTATTLSMVSRRRLFQISTPLGYFATGAAVDFNASRLELRFFFPSIWSFCDTSRVESPLALPAPHLGQ